MNTFVKKLFEKLDDLHKQHKTDDIVVYNRTTKRYNILRSDIPVEKYDTIQDYKRAYYLKNIETYRLRNEEYRKRKKKEKKI